MTDEQQPRRLVRNGQAVAKAYGIWWFQASKWSTIKWHRYMLPFEYLKHCAERCFVSRCKHCCSDQWYDFNGFCLWCAIQKSSLIWLIWPSTNSKIIAESKKVQRTVDILCCHILNDKVWVYLASELVINCGTMKILTAAHFGLTWISKHRFGDLF